jgi:uncharacterized lipoprotein
MSRVVTVAAAAAAAVLGIAGCSSQTHGEKQGGAKDTASAAELARMYQGGGQRRAVAADLQNADRAPSSTFSAFSSVRSALTM